MSRRAFTPEQEVDVIAAYERGESSRQIADRYAVSDVVVLNALRRNGITRRSGVLVNGSLLAQGDPKTEAEALALYQSGESVKRLTERYRCNSRVVTDLLRRAGVTLHPGGRHHPRFRTAQECAAVAADYSTGLSLKALARKYDCATPAVAKAIVRGGGTMREPGASKTWTPELAAWVLQQYEAGRSQQSIADELGVDQTAVSARLRAVGVKAKRASGPTHGSWKGGRSITGDGYALVLPDESDLPLCAPNGNGYVLEHRLVMGRALGRKITKCETVHHINGDKADNRLENLQLRQGKHGSGVVMVCNACGSHDVRATEIAAS